MEKHIFVSYKREDESFAIQLSQKLQTWGYETWRDNEKIPPDSPSWADEIQRGLENSYIVIGILTQKRCSLKM